MFKASKKRLSTEWIIKEVCHTRKNSTEVLTTKVRGSFSIYYNYTYYKFDILCISLKSRHSRRYSAAKKICIDTAVVGNAKSLVFGKRFRKDEAKTSIEMNWI